MTFATGAGASFGLVLAAPATYNKAGYEALTFTEAGEVTNLGDIPARVYALVTHQPLKSRGEKKRKGGYSLGNQTIVMAIDPNDAGQAVLDTATNSDAEYSIRLNHPTLGAIYARALVMGGPKTYGDVNTVATRSVTIEYSVVDTEANDGVVAVPAA